MVLDLAVLQKDAALETDAITDNNIGTDNDVRPNTTVLPDLGGGIYHDISAIHVGFRVGGQQFGVPFRERREVEAGSREEVLGLADVHPKAFQVEGVKLAILADGRESLLFDGGGSQFDAVQDTRVQDVDAGVNAVADKLDGFFHEAVDA